MGQRLPSLEADWLAIRDFIVVTAARDGVDEGKPKPE